MANSTSSRKMAFIAAWLLVVSGCSAARITRTDEARGAYAPEDLGRFRVVSDSAPPPAFLEPEYIIGAGDVLDVVFLFHSNLNTLDLTVRPDGRISLPYLGDVDAAGRTPAELDSLLTNRFGEVLRDPELSVIVKKPAARRVYVLGEVRAPGAFELRTPTTVVQAIAHAGGMSKGASPAHVVVLRRVSRTRVIGVEVNVDAILDGRAMEDDLLLRKYDIVYVPKRPLYSAMDFMQAVNEIVRPIKDTAFTAWQIRNLSASYEFFKNNAQGSGTGNGQ